MLVLSTRRSLPFPTSCRSLSPRTTQRSEMELLPRFTHQIGHHRTARSRGMAISNPNNRPIEKRPIAKRHRRSLMHKVMSTRAPCNRLLSCPYLLEMMMEGKIKVTRQGLRAPSQWFLVLATWFGGLWMGREFRLASFIADAQI